MASITLNIPGPVVTRLIIMMRDEYASMIPGGSTDIEVFTIVQRHWLKKKLGAYEAGLKLTEKEALVVTAKNDRDAAAEAARVAAEAAADAIT